jgi:hypothetical protein
MSQNSTIIRIFSSEINRKRGFAAECGILRSLGSQLREVGWWGMAAETSGVA